MCALRLRGHAFGCHCCGVSLRPGVSLGADSTAQHAMPAPRLLSIMATSTGSLASLLSWFVFVVVACCLGVGEGDCPTTHIEGVAPINLGTIANRLVVSVAYASGICFCTGGRRRKRGGVGLVKKLSCLVGLVVRAVPPVAVHCCVSIVCLSGGGMWSRPSWLLWLLVASRPLHAIHPSTPAFLPGCMLHTPMQSQSCLRANTSPVDGMLCRFSHSPAASRHQLHMHMCVHAHASSSSSSSGFHCFTLSVYLLDTQCQELSWKSHAPSCHASLHPPRAANMLARPIYALAAWLLPPLLTAWMVLFWLVGAGMHAVLGAAGARVIAVAGNLTHTCIHV